ncbi:N-acetylglucosamine kinase [Flavobacteriaceae bacterium]|nr:N-acetylglucosamine kinase [Flavobacteriaceae bacterium]MDB4067437.1 N-acetylglucosamine kinase [Flavobacteriaceae bacterium]MDB4152109.1 N-acetylglucosamine kinase [Flavobacteriaceae bacterium]|tara:strand:- start:16042 stop:16908 length:867 start_codon:yes stop_codon:yes gene_type:complete
MYLIVDSGSTKTDWFAIDERGTVLFSTQTLGLNPQVLSSAILTERIINNYDLYQNRDKVTKLFFYGAGCGIESTTKRISKVFEEIFTKCSFTIKEDTYAAVYASAAIGVPSIVCILGTGSNCSYFDGHKVHQYITSLGYILMDEASGNFYGKQLIRGYYFNEMPKYLAEKFESEFDLSANTVKENLYRKENPNTYLARFAKFMIVHKDDPYMQTMIHEGLRRFIRHQLFQFNNAKDVPIHFVGSISYFLKDEVELILKEFDLTMGTVVKRPIDQLVKYHVNLLEKEMQ